MHAKQKLAKNLSNRIALLKVYESPGPNRSDISDLGQRSYFEVQKQLQFESMKSENFNFWVKCRFKSNELLNDKRLLCCCSMILYWLVGKAKVRGRAIFIFFTTQILAVFRPFFGPRDLSITSVLKLGEHDLTPKRSKYYDGRKIKHLAFEHDFWFMKFTFGHN